MAQQAVALLPDVELLELKGYSRQQVALLMQAVDCFLMTSFTEGSPQVIKEAMVCGCPIVSVDVGDMEDVEDVEERIQGNDGCYIVERSTTDISSRLKQAMNFGRTKGRERLVTMNLENKIIVRKLIGIYESIMN